MCEYLTVEGKCSDYKARPIVCRCFSDLQFYVNYNGRQALLPSCTYAKPKPVTTSKEWMDYYMEAVSYSIPNDNVMSIIDSVEVNPLIDNFNKDV
jgi:Fe-S-cluster containining protein